MKCTNCDFDLKQDAIYCPNCGFKVEKVKKTTKKTEKVEEKKEVVVVNEQTDTTGSSVGWGFLGFFQPIAGLVLFLAMKDKPHIAKGAGIGALIRVIVTAVLWLFLIWVSLYSVSLY